MRSPFDSVEPWTQHHPAPSKSVTVTGSGDAFSLHAPVATASTLDLDVVEPVPPTKRSAELIRDATPNAVVR